MGKFAFDKLGKLNASDVPTLNKYIKQMIAETAYKTSEFESYSKDAFELLDSIESDNIIRVYPHRLFCEKERCQFLNDDALYVVDTNHPSSFFASKFAELINMKIEEKGW